jgi:hypothetical protein
VRRTANRYRFSPRDLVSFVHSDFITWMDRFASDCPGLVEPDPDTEEMEFIRD